MPNEVKQLLLFFFKFLVWPGFEPATSRASLYQLSYRVHIICKGCTKWVFYSTINVTLLAWTCHVAIYFVLFILTLSEHSTTHLISSVSCHARSIFQLWYISNSDLYVLTLSICSILDIHRCFLLLKSSLRISVSPHIIFTYYYVFQLLTQDHQQLHYFL